MPPVNRPLRPVSRQRTPDVRVEVGSVDCRAAFFDPSRWLSLLLWRPAVPRQAHRLRRRSPAPQSSGRQDLVVGSRRRTAAHRVRARVRRTEIVQAEVPPIKRRRSTVSVGYCSPSCGMLAAVAAKSRGLCDRGGSRSRARRQALTSFEELQLPFSRIYSSRAIANARERT